MVESIIGCGAPSRFDHVNLYNASQNPSTMHASDVSLTWFFQRYLLQRAISQFKWKMPKSWEKNYALYCLYCWGFFAVINTDKFGIIPQGCSLKGYNVMYAPTQAVIANPLLKGIREPYIGKQCELVRLQPDYGGIYDLVSFYSEMMSMTASTAGSNIMASKLAYLFVAQNKAFAESFKKMFDSISSGEIGVVVDNKLVDKQTGKLNYQLFQEDLKGTYIASDLLKDLHEWERRFDTEIGIPHTNTDKKERLVSGEVNSNAYESYTRVDMWLETLKECCDKVNKLFNQDIISVEWRINPKELMNGGLDNGSTKRDSQYVSTVQVG